MEDKIEFYVGCGNVFADLDLPDAEELQLKSTLGIEVRLAINAKRLTRQQAAAKLSMSKEQLVELLDGTPFDHSIDQLVGYLRCLDRDVTLSASVCETVPKAEKAVRREEQKVAVA